MNGLRPPAQVMRLARLGAAHQTRLSFMRTLLRSMRRERWRFDRPMLDVDARGVGRAVYRAIGPRRTYSLVAFAHDLPDHLRTDRVIAEAWDSTFALFDGEPTAADLDRLAENVPRQEAGRVSDRELVLSRANRSGRLWRHAAKRLAEGRQPDVTLVEEVGYLMRTTAVYGSGKFGAAEHASLVGRPLMDGPFRAEMLAVWLIRSFAADLVERLASAIGGSGATRLSPEIRRRLGIGNSTGLGMAPFLVNHPLLLNAWILARETAFARVRTLPQAGKRERRAFRELLPRAREMADGWSTSDPSQSRRIEGLRADVRRLMAHVEAGALDVAFPWDRLALWSEDALDLEGQELAASLMLEPHGALVDDLADAMRADEPAGFRIRGDRAVGEMRDVLRRNYGWALEMNHASPQASARFWYVSEAKLEPRLGERTEEPGAELELPLDIARAARALDDALAEHPRNTPIREALAAWPEIRRMARRLQISENAPYSEIRDNLISSEMRPIDIMRCKLAFFGATRFDPRSDRWVRVAMFQNAPYPEELSSSPEDDWMLPPHAVAEPAP